MNDEGSQTDTDSSGETTQADPVSNETINHGEDDPLIGSDNEVDVFNFTWNWGRENMVESFNPEQDVVDLTVIPHL